MLLLGALLPGKPQVGCHRKLEEFVPQQARREEQHFEILDLLRARVYSRDDLVAKFLRLLSRVGRTLVDMKNVGFAVVPEAQPRFHSTSPSPSANVRAMYGCDDPVTFTRVSFADHDDDHMLALPNVSVPPREQPGTPEPNTLADLIGLGQRFCNSVSVLRQQIGMSLRNVVFPLVRRLYLTLEVRARVSGHRGPPFPQASLVRLTLRGNLLLGSVARLYSLSSYDNFD